MNWNLFIFKHDSLNIYQCIIIYFQKLSFSKKIFLHTYPFIPSSSLFPHLPYPSFDIHSL